KGASRIEDAYAESEQRKYFVPCPDCGEHQELKWSNVQWTDSKPQTSEYICDCLGSVCNYEKRFHDVRY
ncbi:phage terminase large subunit family protein, partial [Klebsiella pneumoniae]|uniref:phage terminase large subunit family protein n=1 Tax=Klebsiella pneumoniae TaxID=573 RepID=UPI0039C01077